MEAEIPPAVTVYHDESGDFGHDEWVFTGLLWVRQEDIAPLAAALCALRGDYTGEIHFYRFARNFAGAFGAAPRTGRAWFELWLRDWARRTWLTILAVNRRHPRYDAARFRSAEHAYNHFTAEALRLGLGWHFAGESALTLAIVSDDRPRRAATSRRAGDDAGDFPEHLVGELSRLAPGDGAAGPTLHLRDEPVRCISCTGENGSFTPDEELLQLTDLLLGAVSTAIFPRTRAATKLWFAREMAKAMERNRRPPVDDAPGLHRHLRILYYPDPDSRYYIGGPIHLWDI